LHKYQQSRRNLPRQVDMHDAVRIGHRYRRGRFALIAGLGIIALLFAFWFHRGAVPGTRRPISPVADGDANLREFKNSPRLYTPTRSPVESDETYARERPLTRARVYVLVVNGVGGVVPNAVAVLSRPSGQAPVTRESDGDGVIEFCADEASGATLRIEHPLYASSLLNFPSVPNADYTVFMGRRSAIAGTVVYPTGVPVAMGRVFAWKIGTITSVDYRNEAPLAGLPRRDDTVDIGADGSYYIDGLEEGANYGVTAFGPGYLVESEREARGIKPPSFDVQIGVSYAFGADVLLRIPHDQSGYPSATLLQLEGLKRPLPDSSALQISVQAPHDLDAVQSPACWSTVLMGWGKTTRPSPNRFPIVLASQRDVLEVPATVKHSIVGCKEGTAVVSLPRIMGERLPTHIVDVERLAQALGSLDVVIDGPAISYSFGASHSASCLTLYLRDVDNLSSKTIVAQLSWPEYPSWRVEGIPVGRYDVMARCYAGGWSSQVTQVNIPTAPEVANLRIEQSRAGSIIFDVTTNRGQPYNGSLGFLLAKRAPHGEPGILHSSGTVKHSFTRPPYVIPFVREGEWVVYLRTPPPQGERHEMFYDVKIENGHLTKVHLIVGDY